MPLEKDGLEWIDVLFCLNKYGRASGLNCKDAIQILNKNEQKMRETVSQERDKEDQELFTRTKNK